MRARRGTSKASRPADACPFSRPFRPDFDGCASFQPTLQLLASSRGDPIGPVWTCRQLEAASLDGRVFYGRCRLGTAEERRAQAAARGEPDEALRRLRAEAARRLQEPLAQLYRAKLGAARVPELRKVRDAAAAAFAEFAAANEAELRRAGVPGPPLVECFRLGLQDLVTRRDAVEWEPPPALLARYPVGVRRFFAADPRPQTAAG